MNNVHEFPRPELREVTRQSLMCVEAGAYGLRQADVAAMWGVVLGTAKRWYAAAYQEFGVDDVETPLNKAVGLAVADGLIDDFPDTSMHYFRAPDEHIQSPSFRVLPNSLPPKDPLPWLIPPIPVHAWETICLEDPEITLIEYLKEGMSYAQIGEHMNGLTQGTVSQMVYEVQRRLGLRTVAQLVARATHHKLLDRSRQQSLTDGARHAATPDATPLAVVKKRPPAASSAHLSPLQTFLERRAQLYAGEVLVISRRSAVIAEAITNNIPNAAIAALFGLPKKKVQSWRAAAYEDMGVEFGGAQESAAAAAARIAALSISSGLVSRLLAPGEPIVFSSLQGDTSIGKVQIVDSSAEPIEPPQKSIHMPIADPPTPLGEVTLAWSTHFPLMVGCAAFGLNAYETASELSLSPDSVRSYWRQIRAMLGVRSVAHAVAHCLHFRLLGEEDSPFLPIVTIDRPGFVAPAKSFHDFANNRSIAMRRRLAGR